MPKPIPPPPPLLASAEDRRLAAETIIKGHIAAKGQAWLCCDIPVGAAALLLARHELAEQEIDQSPTEV